MAAVLGARVIALLGALCLVGWGLAILAIGILLVLHDPLDWWHAKMNYKASSEPSTSDWYEKVARGGTHFSADSQ